MTYIVKYRTSRGSRWILPEQVDTLEDAIEIARRMWEQSIDANAYVDVRIEQLVK